MDHAASSPIDQEEQVFDVLRGSSLRDRRLGGLLMPQEDDHTGSCSLTHDRGVARVNLCNDVAKLIRVGLESNQDVPNLRGPARGVNDELLGKELKSVTGGWSWYACKA